MTAGAAGSAGKAGTGGEATEGREAWPGSGGAPATLVAPCHHPTAAAARGHRQQRPHAGELLGSLWKAAPEREQGNPSSSHRQEGSEGWRGRSSPLPAASSRPSPPGTHTRNLGATTQPRGVPALAAPLHPRSSEWQHPLVPQVPPGCPPWGQPVPAPQDPPAAPPAPPCSTFGLIQRLPGIL